MEIATRLLKDKNGLNYFSFFEYGEFEKPLFLLTEDRARSLYNELAIIFNEIKTDLKKEKK
jgi:hypothetical protein